MDQTAHRPDEKTLRQLQEMEDFAHSAQRAHSDVLGSYTGDPLMDERPVQDADDL